MYIFIGMCVTCVCMSDMYAGVLSVVMGGGGEAFSPPLEIGPSFPSLHCLFYFPCYVPHVCDV